jgi:hypothetical protein
MVSGTISLPSPGYFSTFIHITCALSVTNKYLALPSGLGRFTQGFPCPELLGKGSQPVCTISPTGLSPSTVNLSRFFGYRTNCSRPICTSVRILPTTIRKQRVQAITLTDFGLFPFRSPLLREYLLVSLPQAN